jgi:hypothetical protein
VNRFDVSVYAIRRRAGRRRPFEVRWRAAGRSRSKSFITRRLADSYRAELVRAARTGLDFDPLTGEPSAWNLPEPATVTWYQQATAYAAMKWPSLAAHSRASLAEALATVTPALTRPDARDRPDPRELGTALYQYAFNPARPAGPGTASRFCSPCTATASTATRTSSTSRSVASSSRPQDVVRARPRESQRLHRPRDGRGRRPLCVRGFPARPADGPWTTPTPNGHTPKQQPWRQSFILIKVNIRTRYEQQPAA